MKLNELRDNPGAAKKAKRVARGPGSGKGKTAGRGIKGQKSRSGVALNAYEGGQMPLYMRLPKRGFNKPNRKEFAVVNLGLIQKFVDAGKLDASAAIDEAALVASGLVRRKLDGIRVLAKGDIPGKLTLSVTGASKAAVEAVEKAGGTLTVTAPKAEAAAGGLALARAGAARDPLRLLGGAGIVPEFVEFHCRCLLAGNAPSATREADAASRCRKIRPGGQARAYTSRRPAWQGGFQVDLVTEG